MSFSPASSLPPDPVLRVRLTNVSYSLAKPEPGLDQQASCFSHGRPFADVPLIRVLGMTEGGQRACVNIHGAYPYLYIDYPKDRALDPNTVMRFITRLGAALNVALRPPYHPSNPPYMQQTANVLHSIVLCKGTPLYGYAVGRSYFLRIAYLRPSDRWKLMRVLAEGAVLGGLKAKVYEGHLAFVLQFMCDFGLGGCGWLDLADVRFRTVPDDDPLASPDSQALLPSRLRRWTTLTTAAHYQHPAALPSTARTTLELDVHAMSVLNRLAIGQRDVHHDFIELRQGLQGERKLVDSLEELWEDERRRRRAAGKVGAEGADDMGKLSYGERLGSADAIPGKNVGWSSEPRWWAEVDARIAADREALEADGGVDPARKRTLDDLLARAAGRRETRAELEKWDSKIPTAFDALVRGWPKAPLPSAAPEPLPAQSQYVPAPVGALEDAATVGPTTTAAGGSASRSNAFSTADDGDGDDDGALDVDDAAVLSASQSASQLEREDLARALAEADEDYLHPPALDLSPLGPRAPGDAGADQRGGVVGVDPDLLGEVVDPWGEEGSGFTGDLTQVGGRTRTRVRRPAAGAAGERSDGPASSSHTHTPSPPPPPARAPNPAASTDLVPLVRQPYPHAAYFSPGSTRADRKSRSPKSAVRASPLARALALGEAVAQAQAQRTTPRSPSTLRTVRFVMADEAGTPTKGEDDDSRALDDSPSSNRRPPSVGGKHAVKPEPPSLASSFALGPKPARPDFGLRPPATDSRELRPASAFALGRDPVVGKFVPPTFVPPTFPLSASPPLTVVGLSDDDANAGGGSNALSPSSSARVVNDDLGVPSSLPPSPADDAGDTLWQPTYVSPSATDAADGDDEGRSAGSGPSSPESETVVLNSARSSASPSPTARSPSPSPSPAVALEPAVSGRPRKRVRYADDVDPVGAERTREHSSSREEAIPAAQAFVAGASSAMPLPTQAAGGGVSLTQPALQVSSLEQSSSSAENANISMDVSVELAAPPTLPASSSGSGAGFGGLYERRGVHRGPYYSDARDVPRQAREYAGRLWAFGTHAREEDEEPLDDVYARQHGTFLGKADEQVLARRLKRKRRAVEATDDEEARQQQEQPAAAAARWEFGFRAVTRGEAEAWLATEQTEEKKRRKHFLESQHAGSTQKNTQGFKFSQIDEASRHREKRFMSVMVLEILVQTRPGFMPLPEEDPIVGAFFAFQSDGEAPDNCYLPGCHIGLLLVDPAAAALGEPELSAKDPRRLLGHDVRPELVRDELSLINRLTELVWQWDPDILSGWEVQTASWGYVTHRMSTYHDGAQEEFISELSPFRNPIRRRQSEYDADHHSLFQVEGRHVFNLWRMLRSELTLNLYTFENVAFHLLHRRVPKLTPNTVFEMYSSAVPSQTTRAVEHVFSRVLMVVEMLDLSELISRNAEFARVYGVDFSDVWQRGSQFKVESMMFRIGKPESLLFLTPTKEEVGGQQSAECIPLIMEPQSAFYADPVVVLDFQSLYPSIMLAYNICYSTCLGRADRLKDKDGNPTDRFGFSTFEMAPGDLELLEEFITISPNGIMFVKPTLRKSLLAKMLGELLDTRVMIKQAMKGWKSDKNLSRTLNSRQLALKLLANVTYGYTSASFSGRMPHIQMADAIVQYGRESLEKAIDLIHSTPEWGSRVVYGDTDSLFIHMPGKSKEDAFRLGHEIADAITARNPKPMKMKFEKVYLPCVLVAKKRYVGNKFEYPDDEPVFDDKGIETVRRDGIPAQQKELEACIKILFRSQDLSEVKRYMYDQWSNILRGRVSIQDFTFAKEVRLGGYKEGSHPPHAVVAALRQEQDPGDEAQYGERVPYVITRGEPGEPQYKRARSPKDLAFGDGLELDADYYIHRVLLPPLSRVLNLLGADVDQWFRTMPKPKINPAAPFGEPVAGKQKRKQVIKVTDWAQSDLCYLCQTPTSLKPAVCATCRADPGPTAVALYERLSTAEARQRATQLVCASCSAAPAAAPVACVSTDCPTLYKRVRADKTCETLRGVPAFVAALDRPFAAEAEVIDLT